MPTIGGALVSSFGGSLGFQAFQGILPNVGAAPSINFQTKLDVARWELAKEWVSDDTTHSGSFGAAGIDVTCITWRLAAELLWDAYAPPNFLVAEGAPASLSSYFDAGYQFWAYVGSPVNFPVSVGQTYFFSPSAKARMCTTVSDSAGKKKVRARIDVIGNAPIFALGGSINDLGPYNDYIAHCRTRNWVW